MSSSFHIIGSRRLGGAERFFARLTNALARRGNPTTAVLRRGSMIGGLLLPSVRQVSVPLANSLDLWTMLGIRRRIRRDRPHIVQTYLGRASRLTRVPGGMGAIHVARLGGYYKVRSYRHADAWVANTRGIRDYLIEQGMPGDRVFHITNFVEERRVHPEAARAARASIGVPEGALLIFALGRFRPSKGFPDLLDAVALLPESIGTRPVHLAIAGAGELSEALQTRARDLGLAARVHWLGWLTDPDPFYAAADVFVCPSRIEHLGNVILEAWARGAPVVSTRTRGAIELIEDGRTGVLVDAERPAALCQAMLDVLSASDDRRRAIADAGLDMVRSRHSEEAVVSAYLELYAHLRDVIPARVTGPEVPSAARLVSEERSPRSPRRSVASRTGEWRSPSR